MINNIDVCREIHQCEIVVDGHCDTVHLFNDIKNSYDFNKLNTIGHIDLPRLKEGGVKLQFFAVCPEEDYRHYGALRRTLDLFEHFHSVMRENKDYISSVTDMQSIKDTIKKGKIGAFLSVEGGEALEGNLTVLHTLYRLGMRAMGLTWNNRNDLADGVGVGEAAGGLTHFGGTVVREMNRLGILVDAAHLSPRSYYDTLECSDVPVVVSHSNASAICRHRRNLNDDQLRELRDRKGVVGLSFYPPFINENGTANLDDLLNHFCYIAEHFGTEILGVGSDYDGISETVIGLEDVSKLHSLTLGLLDRGFARDEVNQILGGNFLRVIEDVLKDPEDF